MDRVIAEMDKSGDEKLKVLSPGKACEVGMSAERLGKITERLHFETKKGKVTSASILVARNGKVVLHQGFGKLNTSPDAPDTQPDTIYLLASISKPISVCGLILLIEEDKIILSDPVDQYLSEFQGNHKTNVKVRHLLSHTSGLPDMLPENIALRRAHAPLDRFVDAALRTPLLFKPGTQFAYQSMGTLLTGEITERITGIPLRDTLRKQVFEPLRMNNSVLGLGSLEIKETAIVQEDSVSEDSRSWGLNSPYWRSMGHPWGGLHSTTSDLAILLQTFLNGGVYGHVRIFSPLATAAMIRDQNQAIGAPWGQGWALKDSPVWNYFGDLGSDKLFGHVGICGTMAWADPIRQLICVLLTTRTISHRDGSLLNNISNMAQASITEQ